MSATPNATSLSASCKIFIALIIKADDWAGKWAILDDHLSRNTYVGGNSFTMADIPIGPIAYRWYELPIKREEFANLKRWYDALCGRPAFRKHIMTGLS